MSTELEIVEQVDGQLVAFAGKSGLELSATTPLVTAFRPIFLEAKKVMVEAHGVAESVKDATCVTQIKQARACRLAIRKVRLSGEAVRKEQKANALTYGRAVDGFFNILEADLAPIERALLDAEQTAERAEAVRLDAVEAARKAAIQPYVKDVALYAVRDMSDAIFTALLAGVKAAKEQEDAAREKAEADRIAKEKEEAAERERIRAENERLRKESEEKEAALKAERDRVAKEQAAKDEAARKEREAIEAKAKAEREKAAEAAAKERKRLEDEAAKERQRREELEAKAKAEREAREKEEKAEAARRRKAAAAPDKQKLAAFAKVIAGLEIPAMKTDDGKAAAKDIPDQLKKLVVWIEAKSAAL